jgi:hypothetical protein
VVQLVGGGDAARAGGAGGGKHQLIHLQRGRGCCDDTCCDRIEEGK